DCMIAVVPGGRLAATAAQWSNTVALRELATAHTVRVWTIPGQRFDALALAPGGRLLAAATDEGRIYLWDVATGRELVCLIGHRGGAPALNWSPDGTRLVSSGRETTTLVWDTRPWLAKAAAVDERRTDAELAALWEDLGSSNG